VGVYPPPRSPPLPWGRDMAPDHRWPWPHRSLRFPPSPTQDGPAAVLQRRIEFHKAARVDPHGLVKRYAPPSGPRPTAWGL